MPRPEENYEIPQTPEELEMAKKEAGVVTDEKKMLQEKLEEERAKPENEQDKLLIQNLEWVLQNFETWQKEKEAKGKGLEIIERLAKEKLFVLKPEIPPEATDEMKKEAEEREKLSKEIIYEVFGEEIEKILRSDMSNEEKLKKLEELSESIKRGFDGFRQKGFEGSTYSRWITREDLTLETKGWLLGLALKTWWWRKEGKEPSFYSKERERYERLTLVSSVHLLAGEWCEDLIISGGTPMEGKKGEYFFVVGFDDKDLTLQQTLTKENLSVINRIRRDKRAEETKYGARSQAEIIDDLMRKRGFIWDEEKKEYVEL